MGGVGSKRKGTQDSKRESPPLARAKPTLKPTPKPTAAPKPERRSSGRR